MLSELIIRKGIESVWRTDVDTIRRKIRQAEMKPLSRNQKKDISAFFQKEAGKKSLPIGMSTFIPEMNTFL